MYNRTVKKCLLTILFMCYAMFMSLLYWQIAINFVPSYDPKFTDGRPLLIDTPGYQLHAYDPFDKSIVNELHPVPRNFDCSQGKRPLTTGLSNYTKDGELTLNSVLVFHKEYLQQDYGVPTAACCYQSISKSGSDLLFSDSSFETTCHEIMEEITFMRYNAVMVTCKSKGKSIYQNIHLFVHLDNVKKKRSIQQDSSEKPLSVMVFGIDSISRLNMERYMTNTLKVLKDNDAIDLRGYNKVDDNTYPNMIAFLTGKFKEHWAAFTDENMGHPFFDDFPLMWHNFSRLGYTTIFGEDCTSLGLFHSGKVQSGFKMPPTDYYLHPYIKAAEETLGWGGYLAWIAGCLSCTGPISALETLTKYAADLSQILLNVSFFSFIWSSAISHDRIHFAGLTDEPSARLISDMLRGNYWNNTVVLFMSDHGMRFGNFRKSYLGRIEENLPFGFFIFPNWFKEQYSSAYQNLIFNQNRLVTTFDLRETILDIAEKKYKDEDYVNFHFSHSNLPSKVSLFRKIPGSRTCLDALIPIHYCSGVHATEVTDDPKALLSTKYLFKTLNEGLKSFPECHQYSNYTMRKAYIIRLYKEAAERISLDDPIYYEIQWEVHPGSALMEAVVEIRKTSPPDIDLNFLLKGSISRLNSYEGQSNCIKQNGTEYTKFCLCKSLFKV